MYSDVRENSERDINEIRELHDKFDMMYDKDKMGDKLDT